MTYDSAISALADPTRRMIFETIVRDGPQPVGRLAEHMPVSRPAVSQHLAVLAEAGLVQVSREGARRVYAADARGLEALKGWLDGMWTDALANFADAARKGRH